MKQTMNRVGDAEPSEPGVRQDDSAGEQIEDLAVSDTDAGQVQGGFNPQPDPPGRAIA